MGWVLRTEGREKGEWRKKEDISLSHYYHYVISVILIAQTILLHLADYKTTFIIINSYITSCSQ